MGIGKTNAAGGGASLNFDIKAYSTEATLLEATPKENTIGIITTTAISGWEFAAVEPTEPVEGMVWIITGTSSTIAFNALKKNAIQVYPLSAKQYVSGNWVAVAAMNYQGGAWNPWIRYLYNRGDECEDVSGGWLSYAHVEDAGYEGVLLDVTKGISDITFSRTLYGQQQGIGRHAELANLTNASEVIFEITDIIGSGGGSGRIDPSIWDESMNRVAYIPALSEPGTVTIDTSELGGKYFVGIKESAWSTVNMSVTIASVAVK